MSVTEFTRLLFSTSPPSEEGIGGVGAAGAVRHPKYYGPKKTWVRLYDPEVLKLVVNFSGRLHNVTRIGAASALDRLMPVSMASIAQRCVARNAELQR